MSLQPTTSDQPGLQLIHMPDEMIVHIFDFLDVKSLGTAASVNQIFERLQQKNSLWIAQCPEIASFRKELPAKERFRICFIQLGNAQEFNQCILNLALKTITPKEYASNAM
jgi:hypothetical protein